ncbi:hypothetical protein [Streptomyces radicis]|uniref:Uncharacterized protein n=1 Tax=Streptomyces radicis TaxID=1750517 RepID=A0A3A9W9U1_9ACTN|nr:hypothetical protein [Streptomyces radicis]RKN09660.1 hypothetical protein D7319_11400 [Streptomyces radicis]RKN23298.1 hypothetical protein D7318_12355 [Streptomyces radicis]
MTLRFVGKDPESGDHGSPAAWVDESTSDLLFQGLRVDEETAAACGGDVALPTHETIVRIPRRLIPLLREALDVAEHR